MRNVLIVFFSLLIWLETTSAQEPVYPFRDARLPVDVRVVDLADRLTVEEKIGFLCAKAPAIDRLNIPAYDWWSEALHGVARNGKATVFPKPIALGSTWDTGLIHRIADAISDEARAKYHAALKKQGFTKRYEGLTFFSPTLNIARDPRWGRTSECFAEDPLLTGALGTAFVKGLQGDDPNYLKILATPKHFVANNEENRRNDGSAAVDETSLREYYFPAFRMSVEEGNAASVMGAYNALNGIPCCANPFLLTDVLRDEWGFDGVVMSDGSAVEKIYTHHHYADSPEEGAAKALLAGCDMSLRDEYREGLKKALLAGMITEKDIERALFRVLKQRFRLGMFDADSVVPYSHIPASVIESEAHRKLALEAARKSIVLLENKDKILPLDAGKKMKIALIGNDFQRTYYGDYSGLPDSNQTLYEVLQRRYGDTVDWQWVAESSREEPVASQYMIRGESFAYEGKLGLTGYYFANGNLEGDPVTIRHDHQVDYRSAADADLAIRRLTEASVRWETNLHAPVSGDFTLIFRGDADLTVKIGSRVYQQKSGEQPLAITAELDRSTPCPIRIEARNIRLNGNVEMTWKWPSGNVNMTPERVAAQSDVAIIFLRDDLAYEGRDRETLAVQPHQAALVKAVGKVNPNTILLFGSSAPLLVGELAPHVKALLNVWIAGQGESEALAEILFGETNPSGKSPVTFFSDEKQLPPLDDYNITHGRSYQYFKGDVRYPFGYGLSYTEFNYRNLKVKNLGTDSLLVEVQVSNVGNYDGEEVVQCFATHSVWEDSGLLRRLVGFQRVYVPKGKTIFVQIPIAKQPFERWNAESDEWVTRQGAYKLYAGDQSITFSW
ncbi:glycoside hydrolase family 3 protein [Parapedobacter indicus]|uniref:Beta-glucosidase n=1 Tax=Parapedobacter indicus TaxID=1477437 RepID=A0A1I3GSU3_9SPHI|nr:glycoside hydrolase family 3 N-terminal domain-containing protein [Parapedobacter indicus]PPL02766.1 beta-glucosidase [Parapedobacter indicus]SFI26411.1 beta-glucosidase [Parapedobacter indicus]